MKKQKNEVHGMSEFANPRNKPSMGMHSTQKQYPAKGKIEAAGKEVKANPPSILKSTQRKFGKKAARKQKTAIILNKARKGK